MTDLLKIAIDGPGGAGKSTIAKLLASELGLDYIDTGAMYRAVGYKAMEQGIEPEDLEALESMLADTDIDFRGGDVILDGEIVSGKIRTPEVSMAASRFSALKPVRTKLVELQQNMARTKSCIMDGRDIGTNVLKDATLKVYLTASCEERAQRRYKELMEKGDDTTYEEVLEDIRARDHSDMTRELNPLRKAEDAVEVDTTGMSIEEVVSHIRSLVDEKVS